MPPVKKREYSGPVGGAGLMRYFDVDEGGPKMDPKTVVGIVVAVIVLEIVSKIVL